MKNKTVYLESLGCNKNTVDSEIMLTLLKERGYKRVETPSNASILIVNTCAFIDDAKKEAINTILNLSGYKNKNKKLIVAGCLPQLYYREILEEIPEVDAVIGIGDLGAVIEAIESKGKKRDYTHTRIIHDKYREYVFREEFLTYPGSAYLKISEGCSKLCSFCLIPKIKGRHRSRDPEKIVKEAKQLENRGVIEIILTSQDTLSYGIDLEKRSGLKFILEKLLSETSKVLFRLLYLSPYQEIIDILPLFKEKRLLPYFDIPIQHVSAEVLKKMGRKGSYRSYIELIEKIRMSIPDAVLRTTLIVGFPGENEDDFSLLKKFVQEARFNHIGVFCFSPQRETEAYKMKEKVGLKVAKLRKAEIMEIQSIISHKLLNREVGKSFDVLVEESVEGEKLFLGRSYHFAPEVDGVFIIKSEREISPGTMIKARVIRADTYDLYGVVD